MHQRHVMHDQLFRDRPLSTRPLPVLGAWLDKLPTTEREQGLQRLEKTAGNGQPPTTQPKSILIKALNTIDSKGATVWWEAIELWVMGPGIDPYPLPIQTLDQCVLVPSVNQSLAKKGLEIDRIVLNRQECNGPAARLKFQPQHRMCKHSNIPFQRSAGTRLGYAVIQPVLDPPVPKRATDLPPLDE